MKKPETETPICSIGHGKMDYIAGWDIPRERYSGDSGYPISTFKLYQCIICKTVKVVVES